MDRHKIWRIVANNYKALEEASPDGFEPVVDVFLAGRPEPVRLHQVQTSRDPEFPWALLIAQMEHDGSAPSPHERLVFAPEPTIERVELHFERSRRRRVGFSHEVLEDPPPTSKDE